MKVSILVIGLLLSVPCFAEGIYVGGGLGKSSLNYNLHQWAQGKESQYLDDHGAGLLNVPFSYQEKVTSYTHKVFVGYEFNKWVQAELSYKNYGSYHASVLIHSMMNQTGDLTAINNTQYSTNVQATVSADASASASASSIGMSILVTPLHGDIGNVFVRVGLDYVHASWSTTYSSSYQYSYSTVGGSNTPTGSGGGSSVGSTYDSTSGLVPVVGAGIDFGLTKHISLRTEFERLGKPVSTDSTIYMYTASLLYKF